MRMPSAQRSNLLCPLLPGAAVFAGSGAIQSHDKAYWLGLLRRSQHQVQVAAVEPEHDFSRYCLEQGALGIDVPRLPQSPMVERGFRGRGENLDRIFMHSFGRGEIQGLAISDISFGR